MALRSPRRSAYTSPSSACCLIAAQGKDPMDLTGAPLPQAPPSFRARAKRQQRPQVLPAAVEPHLSVVVVNYRDWEGTAALARQALRTPLARRGLVEMVVVDNHSP